MIPVDYITEWRAQAPWIDDAQIEQDLIISRALVEIFSDLQLANKLAFRGGTALYKLYLKPPTRYSEDIDLVQIKGEAVGKTLDAIRDILDPWLGEPGRARTGRSVKLNYRFDSEGRPPRPLRLKIEINSREHFALHGFHEVPFEVSSRWFSGKCKIRTYDLDELLGTKLRALYQRKKGRDLFDLATALKNPDVNPTRIVTAFTGYMEKDGVSITRAIFEENFENKLKDPVFTADIEPLLAFGQTWDIENAAETIRERLIPLLPGDPWKAKS